MALKKGLVSIMLLAAALSVSFGALAARNDQVALNWTLDGAGPEANPFPVEVLNHTLVTLQITVQDTSTTPQLTLECMNMETGETGTLGLSPLSNQLTGLGRVVQFSLAPLWGGLPYPIDPGAVESKPMAILSQRTGLSPYRMNPADLRREFNETAAYMLTTANHRYALPLGDGQLSCRFLATWADGISAASPALMVSFGRGLPDGIYLRDLARPLPEGWPTWVVDAAFDVQLAPPPTDDSPRTRAELDALLAWQAERTPEQIALIRRWNDGSPVAPWINLTLDSIIAHNLNPVRASRALALVSVAIYDASVVGARAAWAFGRSAPCHLDARIQPIGGDCGTLAYPSENTLVAGAAFTVLAYLFPDETERFTALAEEALNAHILAGTGFPSDAEAGFALGRRVGALVIARAAADGSDTRWDGAIPPTAAWRPTPPDFQPAPLEPLAGTWLTWNLASGDEFRPPPPPQPGSEQFIAEAREVYEVGLALTLEQQQIASYWEDKKGSFTPPGHWNAITVRLVRERGLSTLHTALVFAVLNTAQADAFIACWDTKYAYWSERPVTAVRALFDPEWWPYIITPPFPAYVSGHATVSGAASGVLSTLFPDQTAYFEAQAQEAAISRLYGGIHFRSDNEAGFTLGRSVAGRALARIDGLALTFGG